MLNVQVIPAKNAEKGSEFCSELGVHGLHSGRRRTAAYARVSTEKDEQLGSYEAQISYYTEYIKSREDLELVGIYTDAGISAVNTKRRDGFNQMVEDALDGKLDLILTKSVSRFARNTVDSLTTIRKLKEKGVEVFFEKEGIWTFDGNGELLITIMSSLAQEESRNISENVRWSNTKRMQDGKFSLPWSSVLGYEKGADGLPKIVTEEAETVRLIYQLFMGGMTYYHIAKHLTNAGIPTPTGKKVWKYMSVVNILKNELYSGSKLLQKSFSTDYLTKTRKQNNGELPKFYIENSHEAIILPDEWATV